MKLNGSKVVLKLTVTPHVPYKKDYIYRRGDKLGYKTIKMKNNYKPYEITMDLSKYPSYSSTVAYDQKDLKLKDRDFAKRKRIVELKLGKRRLQY